MLQARIAEPVVEPLSESQAAQAMWIYYRDHKADLNPDIKEYRDFIFSQLMDGTPVEQVFAQFTVAPEPVKRARPVKAVVPAKPAKPVTPLRRPR